MSRCPEWALRLAAANHETHPVIASISVPVQATFSWKAGSPYVGFRLCKADPRHGRLAAHQFGSQLKQIGDEPLPRLAG